MRILLVAAAFLAFTFPPLARAQTGAERLDEEAFGRVVQPVERRGCKLIWDAQSVTSVTKACDRVLKRTDLNNTQRGYAYTVRGVTHAEQGNLFEALSDLDNAASLSPHYGGIYYQRGNVHQRLGQMNEAVVDFQRAISLGNTIADIPLSHLRQTCPSLVWEGGVCRHAPSVVEQRHPSRQPLSRL